MFPIISRIASSAFGSGFLSLAVSRRRRVVTSRHRVKASAWLRSFSVRPSGVGGFSPSVGTALKGCSNISLL